MRKAKEGALLRAYDKATGKDAGGVYMAMDKQARHDLHVEG